MMCHEGDGDALRLHSHSQSREEAAPPPGRPPVSQDARVQKASAWPRLLTSLQRCEAIASIGLPGSDSSEVNSQRIASTSVKPQSNSKVSVPCRPRTI